jgi:CHAT domain-containing protein
MKRVAAALMLLCLAACQDDRGSQPNTSINQIELRRQTIDQSGLQDSRRRLNEFIAELNNRIPSNIDPIPLIERTSSQRDGSSESAHRNQEIELSDDEPISLPDDSSESAHRSQEVAPNDDRPIFDLLNGKYNSELPLFREKWTPADLRRHLSRLHGQAIALELRGDQIASLNVYRQTAPILLLINNHHPDQRNESVLHRWALQEYRAGNIKDAYLVLEEGLQRANRANFFTAMTIEATKMHWDYTLGRHERLKESAANLTALNVSIDHHGRYPAQLNQERRAAIEFGSAILALASGQQDLAIQRFRAAQRSQEDSIAGSGSWVGGPRDWVHVRQLALRARKHIATIYSAQGKPRDAEIELLEAVRWTLGVKPAFDIDIIDLLLDLSEGIAQQGRYAQSQELIKIAVSALEYSRAPRDLDVRFRASALWAENLVALENFAEAVGVYDRIAEDMPLHGNRRISRQIDGTRYALALYKVGRYEDVVRQLDRRLERLKSEGLDESSSHSRAAALRALAEHALHGAGRDPARLDPFLARLLRPTISDPSDVAVSFRELLRRRILESAIDLVGNEAAAGRREEVAERLFLWAEGARASSVDVALQYFNARQSDGSSELGELIRSEQDARQRLLLFQSSIAAAVAAREPEDFLVRLREEAKVLASTQASLRDRLAARFPEYSDRARPRPANVQAVRERLRDGEALIAIYNTDEAMYVWCIRRSGPVGYHRIAAEGAQRIEQLAKRVRDTMAPEIDVIERIPEFDAASSNELYRAIFAPLGDALDEVKTLIVASHGPLNRIPFQVLVSRAAGEMPARQVRFENHKDIAYLVKQYAIVQIPSASALVQLRSTARAAPARDAFVGFGDPIFNERQLAERGAETARSVDEATGLASRGRISLRSVGSSIEGRRVDWRQVDQRALSGLIRLPETAEELLSISEILGADVRRDVYLGLQANEAQVRGGNFIDRRVVMFATHGLVAGDVPGLTEPALALTLPHLAGIQGNGLLTSSEIMGLRLNADWVILSACNSAAGEEAGLDAVSGLGRAFFYAGARSILATNWSVETVSAQLLTTAALRRQVTFPNEHRGEALRQAMLQVMGLTMNDPVSGRPVFSYAHPMFWAPYSLFGDPGTAEPRT